MNRPPNWEEKGQKDANDWLKANKSTILARQVIREQKKRHNRRQA